MIVKGAQTALQNFQYEVYNGTGGYYRADISDDGVVTLVSTGKEGDMSDSQKKFYQNMMIATAHNDDLPNVEITIDEFSKIYTFGSFDLQSIDIGDIREFNDIECLTASGILIHEIMEQVAKQKFDIKDRDQAHDFYGSKAEEQVSGWKTTASGLVDGFNWKTGTGQWIFNYIRKDVKMAVLLSVVKWNLINQQSAIIK